MCAEPVELGVEAVSPRPSAEHGAGEEPLAPERDEAAGVEVAGVEGPEAHGGMDTAGDPDVGGV